MATSVSQERRAEHEVGIEPLPRWQAATHHPFLDAVARGSLPAGAFDTWLSQDYLFVGDLLAFQAQLLARAPRADQAVLAGGLVGLEAELGWFEAHAHARGNRLDVARSSATRRYQACLGRLPNVPYATALTSLWAIERAYMDAWRSARPCVGTYREFVEHWTVPAFADYVDGLEQAADRALSTTDADVCAEATAAFVELARIERAFWDMAWSEQST